MNFGCTVDTVDTVDTNFGVNCVNCVNCAPSSKRSPFAVAMHYQQRQRQQQQQEQREGIKTITTTNTHRQTAITILCPGASPALRSPSITTQSPQIPLQPSLANSRNPISNLPLFQLGHTSSSEHPGQNCQHRVHTRIRVKNLAKSICK